MATLFGETQAHITRYAEISDCGRYRWWLSRSWENYDANGMHLNGKGTCCFIMLNPSTADCKQDDPTIRRCIGFAKRWGYTRLIVRNLFPWRATDPSELFHAEDVTGGPKGVAKLLAELTTDLVIVAWGASVPFNRDVEALAIFKRHFPDVPLYCLGTTKAGKPRHPLYVKADTDPQPFTGHTD